jgi:hypothetical protein
MDARTVWRAENAATTLFIRLGALVKAYSLHELIYSKADRTEEEAGVQAGYTCKYFREMWADARSKKSSRNFESAETYSLITNG